MNIRKCKWVILLVVILTFVAFSTVYAAPQSPFKGLWRAVDVDGSNLQLVIAGGGQGIYQLTWTDDYWTLCEGDPGIGLGVGTLDPNDPNIMHTDFVIRCTSRHEPYSYQFDAVYDPGTDSLTFVLGIVWDRVGR
jgi:hypothetical protein